MRFISQTPATFWFHAQVLNLASIAVFLSLTAGCVRGSDNETAAQPSRPSNAGEPLPGYLSEEIAPETGGRLALADTVIEIAPFSIVDAIKLELETLNPVDISFDQQVDGVARANPVRIAALDLTSNKPIPPNDFIQPFKVHQTVRGVGDPSLLLVLVESLPEEPVIRNILLNGSALTVNNGDAADSRVLSFDLKPGLGRLAFIEGKSKYSAKSASYQSYCIREEGCIQYMTAVASFSSPDLATEASNESFVSVKVPTQKSEFVFSAVDGRKEATPTIAISFSTNKATDLRTKVMTVSPVVQDTSSGARVLALENWQTQCIESVRAAKTANTALVVFCSVPVVEIKDAPEAGAGKFKATVKADLVELVTLSDP